MYPVHPGENEGLWYQNMRPLVLGISVSRVWLRISRRRVTTMSKAGASGFDVRVHVHTMFVVQVFSFDAHWLMSARQYILQL